MKKVLFITVILATFGVSVLIEQIRSQNIAPRDCFFLSSLHFTTEGMRHWYGKETGGLEVITGVPYDELECKHCHASGCDRCHKTEKDGKFEYSTTVAREQQLCLECHGRARTMIGIDQKAKQEDVHFDRGMECMDCHTSREIHGDGTQYISMEQSGAMTTQCEHCHEEIEQTTSHTVHGEKLDCKACHVRHVVSCTNCHFDVFIETGKKKAVQVSEWMFLINTKEKVTSANMQTFVAKRDKTFLMFAPHMSHSIMNEGRACDDCHGTEIMKQAKKGKMVLTWMEAGKVQNLKGVIPVVDNVDYECVYLDLEDDKWIPIEKPAKPVYHYPAFGTPLTKKQLENLAAPQ